jgi:hypothetical protein
MARLSGPSRSALQIKSRLSPAFERRQFIEPRLPVNTAFARSRTGRCPDLDRAQRDRSTRAMKLFEAASAALTADAIYFTSKTTSTGS